VPLFERDWNAIASERTEWLGPPDCGAREISAPSAARNANGRWEVYPPVNRDGNLTSRIDTQARSQHRIDTSDAADVPVHADSVVNPKADAARRRPPMARPGTSLRCATGKHRGTVQVREVGRFPASLREQHRQRPP